MTKPHAMTKPKVPSGAPRLAWYQSTMIGADGRRLRDKLNDYPGAPALPQRKPVSKRRQKRTARGSWA